MDPGLTGFDTCLKLEDTRAPSKSQLNDRVAQDACAVSDTPHQQHKQQHHNMGFLSALPRKTDIVRQFTPSWFTVTMGTGTVALSIMAFPFHFPGQFGIAMAVWALNVVLFIIFSCLLLGRAVFFSGTIVNLYRHPNQSLFVGAIPMAFSTITNGVVAFLIPRHGVAAARVAQALFWANIPAVVLCIVLVPFSMFTVHDHGMPSMTAVWLLPVVPACVAGNTAGVVAREVQNEALGISIALIGLVLLGIGFLLSYQIMTIYYNRLICHSLPAREVIVSSFLPVGPTAMTSLAMVNLAAAAAHHLVPYVHTLDPTTPIDDAWVKHAGELLTVVASVLALCVWGFAVWWLVMAISCIAETVRQGIPFSLGWWGSVFPVGTVAIATCQLASQLHSPGLKYLGVFAVCAHVVLWLVVVSFTAHRAWLGQLFHAPCLQAALPSAAAAATPNNVDVSIARREMGDKFSYQSGAAPREVMELETRLNSSSFRREHSVVRCPSTALPA